LCCDHLGGLPDGETPRLRVRDGFDAGQILLGAAHLENTTASVPGPIKTRIENTFFECLLKAKECILDLDTSGNAVAALDHIAAAASHLRLYSGYLRKFESVHRFVECNNQLANLRSNHAAISHEVFLVQVAAAINATVETIDAIVAELA
jgi:hypothetical protein